MRSSSPRATGAGVRGRARCGATPARRPSRSTRAAFHRPGSEPRERQTEAVRGCPHDCGICPDHAQHTCLGIIEVNTTCNLDCPICFAESGTADYGHGYSLTLAQVEAMLDAYMRAEGEPE